MAFAQTITGPCPDRQLLGQIGRLLPECSLRLVVICDIDGVPVGYDVAGAKTGEERESALHLAGAHPGSVMFAARGLWGKELEVPSMSSRNW